MNMTMTIPKYTQFVVKDDPDWYVRQAWNELFPQKTNPYKDNLRKVFDEQAFECKAMGYERPPEGRELTEDEKTFCDMVATATETYFEGTMVDQMAVCVYLAWESMPEEGFASGCIKADDMFDEFVSRGRGIRDYIINKAIQQTTVDPRFAVLKLEFESYKWGIKTLRMPAGNGVDVIYSQNPLPDYPKFDNQMFIPGSLGYYGIVSVGGARD